MATIHDAASASQNDLPLSGGRNTDGPDAASASREPVAQRIMATLEACAGRNRALSLMEIVHETGLAKTTVHRMGWKMVELGLLEYSPDGFSVGSKLFALANTNPSISELRVAAIPHLIDLQRRTGAMSQLAILSGEKAIVLDALFNREPMNLPRLIGYALPLHCTAVGKAIAAKMEPERREQVLFGTGRQLPLATRQTIVSPPLLRRHLGRVAESGIAIADEEFLLGVKSVAAGVVLRGGGIAAIGCVEAWNSPTLKYAPAFVSAAARALEQRVS